MGIRRAAMMTAVAAALAAPALAQTQGQSTTQPTASQNQSQMQTNQLQQPPAAKTNKPSVAAAHKPDQHPELSR